jgi:hypothetical protein
LEFNRLKNTTITGGEIMTKRLNVRIERTQNGKILVDQMIREVTIMSRPEYETNSFNIKSLTESKNALPKDYLTQRKNIQNKIDKAVSESQTKVQKVNENLRTALGAKNTELSQIANKIESQEVTQENTQSVVVQKQHTKGYLAFASALANWDVHGESLIIFIIQFKVMQVEKKYLSCLIYFPLSKSLFLQG